MNVVKATYIMFWAYILGQLDLGKFPALQAMRCLPEWENYNGQATYSCPRDLSLLAPWGQMESLPWDPSQTKPWYIEGIKVGPQLSFLNLIHQIEEFYVLKTI